jgi:hypothetical protein
MRIHGYRASVAQQTPFLNPEKDMKSQVWIDSRPDRHFIGSSDVRPVTIANETTPLRLWRVMSGQAEPEGGSRKPLPSQPWDHASAKPSTCPIGEAHAEFVAAVAGHPPRPIPLEADAIDLEDRADHLGEVFAALSVYVALILDDTTQNAPGRLDLRDAERALADLSSDLTGAIQRAADDMAGRPA